MRFRRRLPRGMRGDRAGLLAAGLVEGGLLAASVGLGLGLCCSRRVWG
jgi:hypothetical protein